MKLYDSIGPNPRVVKMFLAEKGLEIERLEVNLIGGENRQPAHLARNPSGQTPTLELDDGSFLSEVTAICEYLEEDHPHPPLIGATPEQRAETRMWMRRVDIRVAEPLGAAFRFSEGFEFFRHRVACFPEAAPSLKHLAKDGEAWFDRQLAGPWLAGNRFTLADVLLFVFLDFGVQVAQPFDPGLGRLADWFERVKARPSARATS